MTTECDKKERHDSLRYQRMFEYNENGRLHFNKLDFEIFIGDVIEDVSPDNMDDLRWMVEKMVDAVQLCAYEYVQESDDIEDEWEDVYYPAF